MTEDIIEIIKELEKNKEAIIPAIARLYWYSYQELMYNGFTEDEALKIILTFKS